MCFVIHDDSFKKLVDVSRNVELLATGFIFLEGPIWDSGKKGLIFSDIPASTMYVYNEQRLITEFRKPSNMANGNTFDPQGRILTCEHQTNRVTRTSLAGEITVLADAYQGKELNSPNDIIVKRDGSIYFTDPDFGRRPVFGIEREKELGFQGVYRLSSDLKDLRLLADELDQPNGLTFSPDETLLYVDDTPNEVIWVFDVDGSGDIKNKRLFAQVKGEGKGRPDGLKTDRDGNVYCAGPGGIHVYNQEGIHLGVIRLPEQAANFTWGEEDLKTIYVTASSSLYRFHVHSPGPVLVKG